MAGILERLLARTPVVTAAQETAAQAQNSLELAREALSRAELALEDEGWTSLLARSQEEFSRAGLQRAAELCRIMAVGHPLIKRGLAVRTGYIFGGGMQINAVDDTVNEVLQAHLDDPGNQAALYGDQAQETLEWAHGTDGNVFLACFTNPRTGFVQVRPIPFAEMTEIITNPDDDTEPWFYRRDWTRTHIGLDGRVETVTRTTFYPGIRYRPRLRPRFIQGNEVLWDAPVVHSKVNALQGWDFGIGDVYAALPWARAYREFLADWATLMKSLSQYAWRATTGKPTKSQEMRRALARRPAPGTAAGTDTGAGATAMMSPDVTLEAVPKTGATLDSESGRPLASLIAAALGLPVTTLLADPGQTGARAVAETLDEPTRLEMGQRRSVWANLYRDIAEYVIRSAVRAPQGPLTGTLIRDDFSGREQLQLAGDLDRTIDVVFPPLDDVDVDKIVSAIVEADSTQKMPPLTTLRLLLQALGVDDPEAIIDTVTDDQNQWIDPLMSAGQAAIDAYRRGDTPQV
ncbi:hypothetical protein [Ruania rhizosphaerae]|uniref:hypothetical protein n=1 Tax=Ruania rhizosphaerae TaxID=1840413 RepID=UPI00135B140E|nr:hypothetical protein [Ruania rhizosphaerae]